MKILDLVKLKNPISELESNYIFRIDNINEVTNRVLITVINSDLSIPPTELVSIEEVIII